LPCCECTLQILKKDPYDKLVLKRDLNRESFVIRERERDEEETEINRHKILYMIIFTVAINFESHVVLGW